MYPKILNGVILRARNGCVHSSVVDCVAVSPFGETYTLSSREFKMLSMCDGTRMLDDISGLDKFIKDIPECSKIISLNTNKGSINPNQIIQTAGLVLPCRQAVWHLTRNCNMKCSHCYYLFDNDNGKWTFSDREIYEISSCLSDIGIECVRISGGEVSLNSHEFELAVDLLTHKYCIPIIVNTNGWQQQDFIIKTLKDNPFVRAVQISLDGTKISHDKMRGVQSYDVIISNIKKYLENGIHVRIMSMLTDDWVSDYEINKMFDTLTSLGVRDWVVEVPSLTGRRTTDITEKMILSLSLAAQKMYECLERKDHSFSHFSMTQVFDWPLSDIHEDKTLNDPICSHDLGLLSFGPEGVSYCTLFRNQFGKKFANLGQLDSNNFRDIWNIIANVRISHIISDNASCKNCELFSICQGGCPGQYTDSVRFCGCDHHSRKLALVKHKFFYDIGKPISCPTRHL